MACNMPIAATDVGDVRKVIGTTLGCQVCEPTAHDVAEALAPMLRARERTQGRHAIAHLDATAVAQQVIGVYDQVLAKQRRSFVSRSSTPSTAPSNSVNPLNK